MKKVENTFAVTGFIGKDAEIRNFATSSVARFPLAISRTEKRGEDQEETRTSAFINVEAWRKNESASFELLKKKTMITVEGYFKPEEWTDEEGKKHNRVVFVATKFYEPVERPAKKESHRANRKLIKLPDQPSPL